MKTINEFLDEKLTLNNQSKLQVFKSKIDDFDNITNVINYLKETAKNKGLEVKFRDSKTNAGDFTIFIYDKSINKNYLIGFDGYWNVKPDDDISFNNCAKMAEKYINDYKNK